MYIVWTEYIDGRAPEHFKTRSESEASVRFGDRCGAAGVEFVLMSLNGNVLDSWGT